MLIKSIKEKFSGLRRSNKRESHSRASSRSQSSASTTAVSIEEERLQDEQDNAIGTRQQNEAESARSPPGRHSGATSGTGVKGANDFNFQFTPIPATTTSSTSIAATPGTSTMEGRKYVPFVDSTHMKRDNAAMPGYGRVNPAILGGFDDSDAMVLDHDEEMDEARQDILHENRREDQDQFPNPWQPSAKPYYKAMYPSLLGAFGSSVASSSTAPTQERVLSPAPSTSALSVQSTSSRGYKPLSPSILSGFDDEEAESSTSKTTPQPEPAAQYLPNLAAISTVSTDSSASGSQGLYQSTPMGSGSSNRYVAEQQRDHDMPPGTEVEADDAMFGKHYQIQTRSLHVVLSRERIPIADALGSRECSICVETKDASEFPALSITANCTHAPESCLACVEMSIRSDLNSKLWTNIRCLECAQPLEYVDIQKYADEETFARYESLALRAAMAEASNFVWCTSGCGSGQIHESGTAQPIVTCLHCGHRSCFEHGVAWHENLSCHEYDQLLLDPENFRSRLEIANEEWEQTRRHQEDADRAVAQGILAADEAEIRRREEKELQERERARKAADLARQIAARKKAEEEKSQKMIQKTTKPCPNCGWAIEKDKGCSHMTCASCKHEFCYECGADHREIIKRDNTVHDIDCKFHPDNLSVMSFSDDDGDDTEDDD